MSEEKKTPPRAQIFRYFRIESRNNKRFQLPLAKIERTQYFACDQTCLPTFSVIFIQYFVIPKGALIYATA